MITKEKARRSVGALETGQVKTKQPYCTKYIHNKQHILWSDRRDIYSLIGQAVAQERPAVVDALLGVLKRKRTA